MTPAKWEVRKLRGSWTVIPPTGESLPGYMRGPSGGYPFGGRDGWEGACWALRNHLEGSAS